MTRHAPTAQGLLRSLDKRRTLAQIDAMGEMDDTHVAAIRLALEAVSANARIDVGILMDSIRRDVAANAEAEAEQRRRDAPMRAFRYEMSLRTVDELRAIRSTIAARIEAGEETTPLAMLRKTRPARKASPELESDANATKPKRKTRRIRRREAREEVRRAETRASSPDNGDTRSIRRSRVANVMGPRVFDAAGNDLTPEPADTFPPPWIITDKENTDAHDD